MIAEKVLALRIATRKASMCENAVGVRKNTLSLKTKVLFLLMDRPLPPSDIISKICILKTNLALLTNQMVKEGLIDKVRGSRDRREVAYRITDEGREYVKKRLAVIEETFKKFLLTEEDEEKAEKTLDEAISLLAFVE